MSRSGNALAGMAAGAAGALAFRSSTAAAAPTLNFGGVTLNYLTHPATEPAARAAAESMRC